MRLSTLEKETNQIIIIKLLKQRNVELIHIGFGTCLGLHTWEKGSEENKCNEIRVLILLGLHQASPWHPSHIQNNLDYETDHHYYFSEHFNPYVRRPL